MVGAHVKASPVGVYLFACCSAALGFYMAVDGLHVRLFGSALELFGRPGLWIVIPNLLNLPLAAFAWPLTALGTSWLGVMMGVMMGLKWPRRVAWGYALISMAYLGVGSLLSALLMLGLRSGSTQTWLDGRSLEAHHDG
jgi:hypothetical protein